MNMIRNMVWNSLTDYYFKASVMGYAIQRFQKIDRCINIILALASSGSIAAWAIWKEIPYVWEQLQLCHKLFKQLNLTFLIQGI